MDKREGVELVVDIDVDRVGERRSLGVRKMTLVVDPNAETIQAANPKDARDPGIVEF